jgi:hypothetical protein
MTRRWLLVALPLVWPMVALAQEGGRADRDQPARVGPEKTAALETVAGALERLTPEGFAQKGPVERYNEANLYEKINGRSELFHAYGVAGLAFVTFSAADDPARFVDVYLYDMTTPLGAFGIASVERAPGSQAIELGDGGHRNKGDRFFRKGRFYVSILTSGPDELVQKAASTVAERLAGRLEGEAAEIWGLAVLPATGRIEDSIQYLMVDALGLDFLTNTFTAQYRAGGAEFTAFVSRCATEEQAATAAAKYGAYLGEFGEKGEPADVGGRRVLVADLGGGSFDGVCQVGDLVVGVTGVKGREAAVEAMRFVLEGLRRPR